MRRYLIITAVVIVVLGIAVAAYFYFFGGSPGIMVAPEGGVGLPIAEPGTTPITGETPTTEGTPVPVSARLVKISAGPVVEGEAVVNLPARDASSTPEVSVAFIERQSGNVFSYLTHAGTLTRTSNKTIPGIQSAAWLPDGSSALVRYLSESDFSTINTYAISASGADGFFLPQNLSAIAVSGAGVPSTKSDLVLGVLTLASGVNGSVASLSRADGTGSREIFTTPLSALRVSFAGKNQYLVFTKPSATLSGNAFFVDNAGRFSRVAGPRDGLVALASPLGKFVLVSYTLENAMQMELINVATGETLPLPVATIADKCAWTADESAVYCGIPVDPSIEYAYPDDWYQGAVAFSDRIWKIDVSGRFAQLVLDFPTETKDSLDAQALALDPSRTTLVFINKNDGALWAYSL